MSNTETKTGEGRKKFEIKVEEHAEFSGVASVSYMTSQDFCSMVSELFKAVFADFEGCVLEFGQNSKPLISLFFNHGEYGPDAVVACERAGGNGNNASGNSVIAKTRNRDSQMRDGDRYYLTEDGKDAIVSLLVHHKFNNGNPNWKEIVAEYTERSPMTIYNINQRNPQYTKVSFIDPSRLCSLLFGSETEDGDTLVYDIFPQAVMNNAQMYQQQVNRNYLLNILRVSAKEVNKIYEKLGFGTIGTSIIR